MKNLNQLFHTLEHKRPEQTVRAQSIIKLVISECTTIHNDLQSALGEMSRQDSSKLDFKLIQHISNKSALVLAERADKVYILLEELLDQPSNPQEAFLRVLKQKEGWDIKPLIYRSGEINYDHYAPISEALSRILKSARMLDSYECNALITKIAIIVDNLNFYLENYLADSKAILNFNAPTLPWRKVGPFIIKSFIPSEDLADLAEEIIGRAIKILNKRGVELNAFSGLENVFLSPGESTPVNMMYVNQQSCIVILTDSERFELIAKTSIEIDGETIGYFEEDEELGLKFPAQITHNTKEFIYSGSAIDRGAYLFIHELAHHLYYTKLNNQSISFWRDRSLEGLSYQGQDISAISNQIQYVDRAFRQKLFNLLCSRETLEGFLKLDASALQQKLEEWDIVERVQTTLWLLHVGLVQSNSVSDLDPASTRVDMNVDAFSSLINSKNFEKDVYDFGIKYFHLNEGTLFIPTNKVDLDVYLQTQIINANPELLELMEQNVEGLDVISGYGASSWYEDFAEAFAFFVMKPDLVSEQQTQDLLKCLSMSGLINNGVFRRASKKQAVLPRAKIRPLDYLSSLRKRLDPKNLSEAIYLLASKDIKNTYISFGGEFPDDIIDELKYAGFDYKGLKAVLSYSEKNTVSSIEDHFDYISSVADRIVSSIRSENHAYMDFRYNANQIVDLIKYSSTLLAEFRERIDYYLQDPIPRNAEEAGIGVADFQTLEEIVLDLENIIQEIDIYSKLLSTASKDILTLIDSLSWDSNNPPKGEDIETLYHTTANSSDIYQNGFSLDVPKNGGLGGSNKDKAGNPAIAFTSNLYVAKEIMRCLKEVILIARGELDYNTVMRWFIEDVGPYPYKRHVLEGNDNDRVETLGLYKNYLSFQQGSKGSLKRYDPVFFCDDHQLISVMKKYSPRDVGILVCSVDMTYPDIAYFRAMDEFRASPSAVISIDKVLRG